MAAIVLAKRATVNVSKASPKGHPLYINSASRITSTAFQCSQGSSNSVPETRGEGTGPDGTPGIPSDTRNDPVREDMYEAKQEALDPDEHTTTGAAQFAADTAKEGVRKATEMAEVVGDTTKKTMDGAWEAAKEGNERIRESVVGDSNGDNDSINEDSVVDEVNKLDGSVDTVEYRNMEEKI